MDFAAGDNRLQGVPESGGKFWLGGNQIIISSSASAQLYGSEIASGALALRSTTNATKGAITVEECTTFAVTASSTIDFTSSGAGITLLAAAASNVSITGAIVSLVGVVLCSNGTSAGEIRIQEASGGGSSYIAFQAPSLAANVTYILPSADGSSGQFLSTNGSGTLSWASGSEAAANAMLRSLAFG